jgi:K+-sensing histidine kinase KdpD
VVAAAITTLLGGGIAAALAGVLAFFVVNYLMIMLAISVASARPFLEVVRESVLLNLLHEGGNASVGLLGAWLFVNQPAGLLGLVVPIGLLWRSYAQQAQRAAEARLFEELAHGQEKVLATSVDTSAQVIVTAAARTFGGAEVELLLRHPDGLVRYLGDENGLVDRSRVEPEAFGAAWVLQALANRGVQTGIEQGQPYCSAVLGDVNRPLAVLIARRPRGRTEFTRADAQLAEVLAAQAQSWLSVADLTAQADEVRGEVELYRAAGRVLGDIGADTAPSLVVLRESADRLARLAKGFDGPDPVSEIVEELHAVERAVASLLGAVAMAQPNRQNDRPTSEWTTTGRLESADTW